jgi:hypothetical protein
MPVAPSSAHCRYRYAVDMPTYNCCVRGIAAFSASWHQPASQPASFAIRHTLVVTTTRPPSTDTERRAQSKRIFLIVVGTTGTELARSTVWTLSRSIRGKASALRVFMGQGVVLNWHPHDIHAPFACSTVPGSLGLFFREPTCPLERADTSFCDRGVPVTSRYSLWDSDFWDTERSAQFLYARAPFRVQKK